MLRVQLQLRTSTRISLLAKQLYAKAGIRSLYAGISAAWLRQIMYGAPRLGIYSYLYENVCDNSGTPPFLTKLALGLTAGSIGAICGTPAEVALVRMSADAGLPAAKQRGYRNALDCIVRVTREEGVLTLWRGSAPTVARAALVNMGQLGFYSELKEQLCKARWRDQKLPLHMGSGGLMTMFFASLGSSFVGIGCSMPLDVAKSRLQNMKPGQYIGMMDCLAQSVRSEGPTVLWRFFFPAWMKLAPYTVVSFTVLEWLTKRFTSSTFG